MFVPLGTAVVYFVSLISVPSIYSVFNWMFVATQLFVMVTLSVSNTVVNLSSGIVYVTVL